MLVAVAVLTGLALAFANGANDNSKGVATLVGSRTMELGTAVRYAAVTTLLGSFAAIFFARTLVDRFGGKGIVDDDLARLPAFAASVGIAASLTVLLATRLSMPISTTHALVGSIVGIGLAARALDRQAVLTGESPFLDELRDSGPAAPFSTSGRSDSGREQRRRRAIPVRAGNPRRSTPGSTGGAE